MATNKQVANSMLCLWDKIIKAHTSPNICPRISMIFLITNEHFVCKKKMMTEYIPRDYL